LAGAQERRPVVGFHAEQSPMASDDHHPIQNTPGSTGPATGAAHHGFWWKTWQVLKVVQARLRFVAILAVVGVLIAYWDTLNNYYEKWTQPPHTGETAAGGDVEYFCPMHPFIVRDTPKE